MNRIEFHIFLSFQILSSNRESKSRSNSLTRRHQIKVCISKEDNLLGLKECNVNFSNLSLSQECCLCANDDIICWPVAISGIQCSSTEVKNNLNFHKSNNDNQILTTDLFMT